MAAKKVVAKDKEKPKAKTSSAKTATEVVKPGPEGRLLLTLTPISDSLRTELRAQKSEAACEALGMLASTTKRGNRTRQSAALALEKLRLA